MLKIITFPDPLLRTVSTPLSKDELDSRWCKNTFDEMEETLLASGGIGLAAVQVGLTRRMVIVDKGLIETKDEPDEKQRHSFLRFVNPVVEWQSDEMEKGEEGCLSFPGGEAEIERPAMVRVSFEVPGKKERKSIRASGLLARCLQHEVDHLDGVTIPDYLRFRGKLRFLASVRRED